MSDIFIKNIPHEQITTLASQVEVQAGQVVSKTLAQNDALSITIFSFDKGEEIGTHGSMISSAALGVILNLSGLAAGAATIGCCCNMIGFAVASWRENKFSGFLAQGIGTSMLQIPNIVRRPLIWLPVILSSAVLGPIGTMLLHMTNNATGSGMGTAGLVGSLMTWQVMTQSEAGVIVLGKIILIQFILPAAVTLLISEFMRKKKWIRQGDMKLEL